MNAAETKVDGAKGFTFPLREDTIVDDDLTTNTLARLGPHDKRVDLQYFQGEKYVIDNNRYATSFAQPDMRTVVIRNIRDLPEEFTLDRNGFELHTYPTEHKDFSNEDTFVPQYYEECHTLLQKMYATFRPQIDMSRVADAC